MCSSSCVGLVDVRAGGVPVPKIRPKGLPLSKNFGKTASNFTAAERGVFTATSSTESGLRSSSGRDLNKL